MLSLDVFGSMIEQKQAFYSQDVGVGFKIVLKMQRGPERCLTGYANVPKYFGYFFLRSFAGKFSAGGGVALNTPASCH